MPIPENEEPGVLLQQQQSSNFPAAIPIKKRKFPIILSPSPSPEERLSASEDNNSNNREDFKSSGEVPSLNAAIDICSSGKSDMSKKSVLTANHTSPSGKSDMSKNSVLTAIDKVSDMSKNSVLVSKNEQASIETNVHLLQTNLDMSASEPRETKRCNNLVSMDGVVNKVNFLSNEKSAGSGVPGNNMGAIVVNVKKEIDSPQVEGDCRPNLSIGSGNVEFLLKPKEPLVPALEPKNSERTDKLDSSLLNLSLYRDALVTREISDDALNNVSSHVYANNRTNWDLNAPMDAWEPSVKNNALVHNTIGIGKFNNNSSGYDLKHSSCAVGTTGFSLDKGKNILHEQSSSFPISSVQPRHEYKTEDSLCLSLGIPYRELNSNRDHSSLSDKADSVRVDSNSKLQTVQLSTMNMNSASCGSVKLEPVDENRESKCTAGTSSTMELSRLSLMKLELIESCSSETVVPSSSNSQKVVDPRPIKSELFQESNNETSKPADSILPQSVEKVMQHQESCASSSVLSMPLSPLNSCPSRLPTFSESTTSEDLSYQSEHSHTKHFCNRKDIPDEPIDAVVPRPVSQKGKETSVHSEKVENLITEDPERCKLNRVDEHPIELCGKSEVAASDEENTNIPTDMPGADTFGSNRILAFANHKGIGKRQHDKEDEDYEDGEVRESLMHPTVEDSNVDRKEENVKLIECDTRNMESSVFYCDKNCNISDLDGNATVLDNHHEMSSDQIKVCVDMGPNEPDGEDDALQKSLLDEVTEAGLDNKSSNFVSPEKQLNLSGGEHVEEGDEKEVPDEGAINKNDGMEATLGEKATDKRIEEISYGDHDSTLPKAEASVDNNSNNNNAANPSNNASNKSRIINLPRTSVAASPCKTVSIPGRLSTRSGKERCSDLEGEIQLRGNRDEIYTDGPKRFVKDWNQHQSFRNSRPSFIARRGRLSGRFDRLHNDWDSNHEFASESYNVKADYQVSRRKHASSIADIELDYNGYGIAPDNSALRGGRRKALNDEMRSLRHPSSRRISPRGRDGPTMRGIPMLRRIPRNVSPSRFTDEDGSDMVGFRHNGKYIPDDIMDPVFTRPQTMYDELDGQLVRGNRKFSTLQRKDYSRVRSKSPIRSRTRSPGPWSSPWRRSPDGHPQLPQHRSPTMYRMGRMRTPDHDCFPDEVVGRRRESPTFMAQPSNDIRDVDTGREHILHRSDNSNRRTPPGRVFPRNTRRVNVLDPRERADGNDYMSGTVHSSRYHDVSGDERRKFGGERRGMSRSFRPAYNNDNDNVRFHSVNDGPRPFRFRPDGETDFIERSTMREREFDGRIKHQPLFVSGRMRNIEEQQDRMRNIEEQQDGNHRPSGQQQVWHDQGFNDVSRVKRRRF